MVLPRGFQSINFSLWARALPIDWRYLKNVERFSYPSLCENLSRNLPSSYFLPNTSLLSPTSVSPSGGRNWWFISPVLWCRSRQPTVTFGKREACRNRESFEKAASRSWSTQANKLPGGRFPSSLSSVCAEVSAAVGCRFYRFDLIRVSNFCHIDRMGETDCWVAFR